MIDVSRGIVLITGPTSGLGEGFARRYAADGHDLILVARDRDRLATLAAELSDEYGIKVETLPADLTQPADRSSVTSRLADGGVQILVNNAGFGASGDFWTTDEKLLEAQLAVNIIAVMELTRAALPPMLAAQRGTIINVASVAGLVPSRSAYAASKAWVIAFTKGLANGLGGTGVGIHAVAPGLMRTEFHERAGIDMANTSSFLWLDIDDVVRTTLVGVDKAKVVIVPGLQYKVMTVASRLVPPNAVRRLASLVGLSRRR